MNCKKRFSQTFLCATSVLFFAIQFSILVILVVLFLEKGWSQNSKNKFFIFSGILFFIELRVFSIIHRYFLLVSHQTELFADLGVKLTEAILMNEDMHSIFLTVLDYVLKILGNANFGSIHAITKDGKVEIVASRGYEGTYCNEFSIPLEYAFWYRQSKGKTKEPLIIEPEIIANAWHLGELMDLKIKSVISAPLYVEGNLYGFINIDSRKKNNFKPHDLKIISKIKLQVEVCLLARLRYEKTIAESRADCLTGFHSRTHFSLLASHTLAQAKRNNIQLILVMLDIDDLKSVNDKYGHQSGDLVIMAISDAIKKETRKPDIIGRYGGDEFIGLFPETSTDSIELCLNRSLDCLKKEPVCLEETELVVSFCYGCAKYPEEGHTLDELIKIADAKLYTMKESKK